MSTRSYSGLLLAGSNFASFVFPLLRGVFLARLLSPEDFGLAISITTVAVILEILSDIGLNQFAVRVSSAAAIPTVHSISVIRATVMAATIVVCSPLFAHLFNAPGTAWAYAVVGLSPLIRGFYHFDVKSAMRSFNFAKEAITELVANTAWTVATIATAAVLHDYRATLVGLLAHALAIVGTTHLLSQSPWRLGWDRTVVREAAHFGRLLIPNGAATVLVNMGDRTLVGSYSGLDALAAYSVLGTSAFMPRSALVRYLNALMTPQFVNAPAQAQTDRLLVIWTLILSAIGSFFAFGYMAFGQPAIMAVFGTHYAVAQGIVTLIAVLSCIRFLAAVTTPISVARGDTGLIFLNTATAGTGLGLGLVFLLRSPTLQAMVSGMCAGELAALLYIVGKLLRSNRAVVSGVWSAVLPTLLLVLGCAATISLAGIETLPHKAGVALGFSLAEFALLAVIMFANRISMRDVAVVFLPRRLPPTA